jgi:hypothetical protein
VLLFNSRGHSETVLSSGGLAGTQSEQLSVGSPKVDSTSIIRLLQQLVERSPQVRLMSRSFHSVSPHTHARSVTTTRCSALLLGCKNITKNNEQAVRGFDLFVNLLVGSGGDSWNRASTFSSAAHDVSPTQQPILSIRPTRTDISAGSPIVGSELLS